MGMKTTNAVEVGDEIPKMGQVAAQTEEEIMAAWMAQFLCVGMRGMVSCFPTKPIEKVLILSAAVFGQQLGALYGASDDLTVHKVRRACRDAFCKALSDAPVIKFRSGAEQDTASIGLGGS